MGKSSNNAKPLVAAGLALAVGACSWFGGEAPPRRAGAETKEPNLASVPAKPQPVLTADQRKALTQDLVRDRENARYTSQEFRIGSAPEAAPPRPAPPRPAAPRPSTAPVQPAPAAPAPAAVANVTQTPADPIPPAGEAATREAEAEESPWWWPFGGRSSTPARPPAAPPPAASAGPTVTATPENMQAAPGVMPVTGKALPQPEQGTDLPAPIAMAPVPPTPPPGSGVALPLGSAASPPPPRGALPPALPAPSVAAPPTSAPLASTIPVPPPVDAGDPARMQPDAIGAAPPPPPALAAVPSAPPPRVASASAPGVSRLVAQVEFAETGATLPDSGKAALEEVERLHRERAGRVRVVALTPRGGASVAGDAMLAAAAAATERGNAVKRELVRLGVPEGDIVVSTAPAGTGRDLRRVDTYLDN
ncbi:hypothetical protein STVA_27580 [Allostella vacuolata]|nr:hypothetical protein STVA_27580 [Stella vacuolata]